MEAWQPCSPHSRPLDVTENTLGIVYVGRRVLSHLFTEGGGEEGGK